MKIENEDATCMQYVKRYTRNFPNLVKFLMLLSPFDSFENDSINIILDVYKCQEQFLYYHYRHL